MSININIRERDIYKFILDELNDTVFKSRIKFMLGDSARTSDTTMLIRRFTLNATNDSIDIVEELDELTYMTKRYPYVITNIGNLNPQYTALNTIKEATFDGVVNFLICEDDPDLFRASYWALEEVRSRLIQYHKVMRVQYYDMDNTSSSTWINEDIKLVVTSGGLSLDSIERINGRPYSSFSMPITIIATNYGEFANQEVISIGVSSILEGGNVKMFEIEPIEWGWGMGIETDTTQLVNDKAFTNEKNSERGRGVPKNKSFSWGCTLQIDFRNALLKKLYKDSRNKNLSSAEEIWYLKSEIKVYNPATQAYEVDDDLTFEDTYILNMNKPAESLSKGDKLIWTIGLEPYYIPNEE